MLLQRVRALGEDFATLALIAFEQYVYGLRDE